ncbi:MAG TPA: glycosyltransferase family 1 protein [Xanthomonadaceae bacterium]|nr:glycosyltransferase family 1 protein [Xanthomonadaceae bacterium]
MHVALVTETYPPEINGVALTVHNLRQGLLDLGHRVSLVRPQQPNDTAEGVPGQLLVRGMALPRYPGLRFGLPARRRLERSWRQQRPDAIYVATEGPLGWSAVRAATGLDIPVATGFHTRFDEFVRHYGAGFLTPLVFGWMRRFHNRAQATLVPTGELRDFLAGQRFDRPVLLSRGVDTHKFAPSRRDPALRTELGIADDALLVSYVGRIAPEKNLDLAVRAFRAIQQARPNARYLWVGDGPARAALARENPDFLFAGMQRDLDLARHFASSDLFLFPSLSETFGNVTLEAMACGVATVAFDYGAAREHLQNGLHGAALAVDDADGFVAAARSIATDDALRRNMGHSARAAVEHLGPAAVARSFADLLSALATERTG